MKFKFTLHHLKFANTKTQKKVSENNCKARKRDDKSITIGRAKSTRWAIKQLKLKRESRKFTFGKNYAHTAELHLFVTFFTVD